MVQRESRRTRELARGVECDAAVGQRMRDGLELADRAPELLARAGVLRGVVHQAIACRRHVARERRVTQRERAAALGGWGE